MTSWGPLQPELTYDPTAEKEEDPDGSKIWTTGVSELQGFQSAKDPQVKMFSLGVMKPGLISYLHHRLIFSSSSWYMFMEPQPHHPSPPWACTPSPTLYRQHKADRKHRELLQSKNEAFWEWGKGALVFIKISSLNQLCQGKPARRWEHMAGRRGGRDMAVLT